MSLVHVALPVPNIERFVIDEKADQLAIGHIDQHLARLGIPVSGLRVGERHGLVEGVEVGPRDGVRLALVQVGAPADVAVGQGEDRLRLAEQLKIERLLAQAPALAVQAVAEPHQVWSSSARSVTTTLAPCSRSASAWPTRSTPTTRPKRPARPASTPARASSYTAAASGLADSSRAASR